MQKSKKNRTVGSKPEKPITQTSAPEVDWPTSGAVPMGDHYIAKLFPLMSDPELDELAEDIKLNGQRDKIITYEGQILDGRNRYRACVKAGVKTETTEFPDRDPVAFVLSKNAHRRNLSSSQRAMVAAQLPGLKKGDVATQKGGDSFETPISSEQAAKIMGVSRAHVGRAKKVMMDAPPDIIEAVKAGALSLGKAERKIRHKKTTEPAGDEDASLKATESTSSGKATLDPEPDTDEADPGTVPASVGPESAKRAIKELKSIPKTDPGREDAFRTVLAFVRKNYPDLENEK